MTLAIFNLFGKTPALRDWLMMQVRGEAKASVLSLSSTRDILSSSFALYEIS